MLLIASSAINSHAALFDDKEARKKILEVEAKSQSNFEANHYSEKSESFLLQHKNNKKHNLIYFDENHCSHSSPLRVY